MIQVAALSLAPSHQSNKLHDSASRSPLILHIFLCLYLQGEDPSYMWVLIVLGYWLRLVLGIISAILSIAWLLQVVLYIFLSPPLDPFLNNMFKALDAVFPLFGTAAFAVFCFYLIGELWRSNTLKPLIPKRFSARHEAGANIGLEP